MNSGLCLFNQNGNTLSAVFAGTARGCIEHVTRMVVVLYNLYSPWRTTAQIDSIQMPRCSQLCSRHSMGAALLDNLTHPQSIEALLYMPCVSATQTSLQSQEHMMVHLQVQRLKTGKKSAIVVTFFADRKTQTQLCRLPSPDSQMSHPPASVCSMVCLFHRRQVPVYPHQPSAPVGQLPYDAKREVEEGLHAADQHALIGRVGAAYGGPKADLRGARNMARR